MMMKEDIKHNNRILIISHLQKNLDGTKKDIAQHTKLSITTVSTILSDLKNKEIIIEAQKDNSTGGRRAWRYTLNPEKKVILNIIIDSSILYFWVLDIYGEIIYSFQTNVSHSQELINNQILSAINQIIVMYKLELIGLGVPGIVQDESFYNDGIINQIGQHIKKAFNVKVYLINDLNATAYGYINSINNKEDSVVYLHVNESCSGAGVVMNGDIIYGRDSFAGEIGYIPFGNGLNFDQVVQSGNQNIFIEAVVRLIATINCVINPDRIILGGKHKFVYQLSEKNLVEKILQCKMDSKLPNIVLEKSYIEFYKKGMDKLSMKFYLNNVLK